VRSLSLALLAATLSACIGITPPDQTSPPVPAPSEPVTACSTDYRLICEAVDLIQASYVDEVDPTQLAAAATRGIEEFAQGSGAESACAIPFEGFDLVCQAIEVKGVEPDEAVEAALVGMVLYELDPNSAYFDEASLELIRQDQLGQVEGIGAVVTTESTAPAEQQGESLCPIISPECRLVIVSTFSGAPAERAGILAGDVVVEVDGLPIAGKTIDEVTAQVRGEAGTPVELALDRDGRRVEVSVIREAIEIPVVESQLVDRVGYLRLNSFSANSGGQVDDTLRRLLSDGAETLIIDLRDNPGGTLTAAIDIASEFVDEGLVLATSGPDGTTEYPADGKGTAVGIPTTVLINQGSASASEVVAGALQDAGAALVVGHVSYGKNTVQQTFDLSNGGALKLTIARWVTRAGRNLDNGVIPDVELDLPADLAVDELVALVSAATSG
jgi:carboxyl-terminal processing protease